MVSTESTIGDIRVEDDEGVVDRKTKEHILNLRAQVDDDERMLYVEHMTNPEMNLTVRDANEYWGISVRQYLRGIKRLWSDDTDDLPITNVGKYWEEVEIGRETLVPPDTQDYPFSIMEYYHEYDESHLRQHLGLPRGVDLPRPHTETFQGLKDVLNRNRIGHRWVVTTNNRGPPPEHEQLTLSVEMPVPKHILENAVEAADTFLQQAGVGFEVGAPAYMGGDEPGI